MALNEDRIGPNLHHREDRKIIRQFRYREEEPAPQITKTPKDKLSLFGCWGPLPQKFQWSERKSRWVPYL